METVKLASILESSKGFLLTYTTIDDQGNLKHEFMTRSFPLLDMLPSNTKHKELIADYLSNPPVNSDGRIQS